MSAADRLVCLESYDYGLGENHVAFAGSKRHQASLPPVVMRLCSLDHDIAGYSGVAVVRNDVEDDRTSLLRVPGTLASSFESESRHSKIMWFVRRLRVRQVVV